MKTKENMRFSRKMLSKLSTDALHKECKNAESYFRAVSDILNRREQAELDKKHKAMRKVMVGKWYLFEDNTLVHIKSDVTRPADTKVHFKCDSIKVGCKARDSANVSIINDQIVSIEYDEVEHLVEVKPDNVLSTRICNCVSSIIEADDSFNHLRDTHGKWQKITSILNSTP